MADSAMHDCDTDGTIPIRIDDAGAEERYRTILIILFSRCTTDYLTVNED